MRFTSPAGIPKGTKPTVSFPLETLSSLPGHAPHADRASEEQRATARVRRCLILRQGGKPPEAHPDDPHLGPKLYDARVGVQLLTERYQGQIAGVLSCYDRIIIQGTLPKWCYAKGMTDYFYQHQIRIFDYPQWAEPLRDAIRQNMERIAAESGTEIVFVRSKKKFRQEKHVRPVLDQRGEEPGVVCILSAMEPCGSYKPWHDQRPTKRPARRLRAAGPGAASRC